MLTGKNIIVTGARRGIGRSVVEICSKYGANIWACARKGYARVGKIEWKQHLADLF